MSFDLSKLSLGGGFAGNSKAFQCPVCSGFSSHLWNYEPININGDYNESIKFIIIAQCQACNQFSIWITNEIPITYSPTLTLNKSDTSLTLIFPNVTEGIPKPNNDMPDDVKEIYIEAGEVLNISPRASAALSRLAIEKLVDHLNAQGKDLNTQIGNLVSKGMPIEIQQMLDSVRVIGNNAVHPGQIDIKDNKELALSLLNFINLIVDNRITQPKKILDIYNLLPESYRNSIERRDN
ncbi:DUF4145 domain-containing protein [Streptococcus anginosus]|uniref:DUF4145 domain-containing protein n=1 Tax=Streptococcus anginosus TaxID=1328 RepID=A0ABT3EAR2_STRAP|nr:DUF4145 domain-containing protein [Streptococcus anginosus]KAA9291760.1 DUF4145 domain-containing protein [Streptococcus anginosus]MCW1042501.1 DUF4145 domain-containing protein [Streptococcus anginosus]MED5789131.1 DUF4145 domain-containing protein [Streptococcus anginosus]MED5905658.1 DUF4145 domain-containing protein [Streptococcus anginosus]